MKWIHYIRYLFYIASFRKFRPALSYFFHELRSERKYRINTIQLDNLKSLTLEGNTLQHASIYQASGYESIEQIFLELKKLKPNDGFIDIGSGRGRVMVLAAYNGFTDITGVEFARELCVDANKNCKVITTSFPATRWKIIHTNAINFRFEKSMHVFFFFNPFNEIIMKEVVKHILLSLKTHPRKIHVIYLFPEYPYLFTANGFKEVQAGIPHVSIYEKDL